MFKKIKSNKKSWLLGTALFAAMGFSGFKAYQYNKYYISDFEDRVIESQVLNESRKIFIRLPENYSADKQYPLIIRSDGNFNLARWDAVLDEFAEQKTYPEAILVSIPNQFWTNTRNRDLVPPYARRDVNIEPRPASDNDPEIFGKADLFLSFIETEVLPYMHKHYSLSGERILSGYSAGGSFVIYTMVTKPDLFNGYFAFSPAAWYDDSVVVEQFRQDIQQLAGKPKLFYLSLGAEEPSIITGSFNGLIEVLEQGAPENLTWQYSFSQGAGHGENPVVSVPKALTAYQDFRAKHL
ncbi:alpha/beta hydrolase-fold protein [Pseudoalteromonas sp. BZB3]|uniref:alpha/beta hydrolase n=1 Tax=unclassified Pseudoalteromonas TaxID=194690 RepID=UPI0032C49788